MGIVSITNEIGVPKYKQIISSIENAIRSGVLKKGDKLPSLNSIRNQHSLSRDTVLVAFNELKNRGVIQSVVGKGYYVASEDVDVNQKIFLLFDEFNSFKEDLYNSFRTDLGLNASVDIFFHHFNIKMFEKLIKDNAGDYSHYVLMPANLKGIESSIKHLPKDKVYILDQTRETLLNYPSVHQNFKKNIYNGLLEALPLINKYEKLVLLFSDKKQPQDIIEGFKLFCNDYKKPFDIVENVDERGLTKGEVYLILDDRDLIWVIKKMKESDLKLIEDLGIISYNDTLLKEIVENGITTISTDFKEMGKCLANMIINNQKTAIENKNELIIRKSL
ncbi:GntR family transcriptional regulator [uncultured Aquimarina sp.]|uniref:GntR family transcriptional regulator n=1 Tax=uncultured Aquimarina sp. TaxID=575652 RepID=UPI00262164C2|nr:GntR family transcriptional regulator [uncultured Aquimarina sp.]